MTMTSDRKKFAVLVVEDDPLLLIDAVDMLEDEGFTVYPARSAAAAIRLLERHDDIRVLFTDVDMPGSMDGLKLAHAVKDRWPPVRIMVTSGLLHISAADVPKNGLFFAKPYPPGTFCRRSIRWRANSFPKRSSSRKPVGRSVVAGPTAPPIETMPVGAVQGIGLDLLLKSAWSSDDGRLQGRPTGETPECRVAYQADADRRISDILPEGTFRPGAIAGHSRHRERLHHCAGRHALLRCRAG